MTPTGLWGLAERYGVSREAVAVNAVKNWGAPVAVAFARYSLRPSSREIDLRRERPRWRVERAFHAEGFPAYLHRGMAFADEGVVGRAARAECEVGGVEMVGKNCQRECRVVARPLGRAGVEPPRMMVVAVQMNAANPPN